MTRMMVAALSLLFLAASPEDCVIRIETTERNVPARVKTLLYDRLGIEDRSCCVIDHVIPKCLGGSDDLSNLQVQERAPAKEKDRVEVYLSRLVCRGEMGLEEAQEKVQRWRKVKLP